MYILCEYTVVVVVATVLDTYYIPRQGRTEDFRLGGGADSRILLCKRMHSLSKYTVAIVATVLDVHFILRQGRTKDFLLGAWNFQISTMGTYENTSYYNCPHIQTIDTYRGFFTKMEGGGGKFMDSP